MNLFASWEKPKPKVKKELYKVISFNCSFIMELSLSFPAIQLNLSDIENIQSWE